MCWAIQFGIFEQPSITFSAGTGEELGDIPQTAEDNAFAAVNLAEGCQTGIYREVSPEHAQKARAAGAIISSALVVWQETDEGQKPEDRLPVS